MSDEPLPNSEIILYQTENSRTRIPCRFEHETLWLTQAQIAELFETTPQNVTLHLKGIFAEGELLEGATCKDYLQVRLESRTNQHLKRIFSDNELQEASVVKQYLTTAADGKGYQTKHYSLQAIIACSTPAGPLSQDTLSLGGFSFSRGGRV